MKRAVAIVVCLLIVTVTVCGLSTSAMAKKHHGHHGHHGFHGWNHGGWGWGYQGWGFSDPDFYDTDNCYMVRKCWRNRFGERRCRWVEVCD